MTTARLVDLGLGGAGVVTEAPLSPSRSYSIVLEDGESRVERTGRVVWKGTADEPGKTERRSYRVGVAFEDATLDAVSELLDFIHRHHPDDDADELDQGSVSWTARTSTRYRLSGVRSLKIQVEHGYQIHNLSMSGMLIETRVPLRPEMRVALTIDLPEGEVRTVGRVVQVRTVGDAGGPATASRVGIEFVEMGGAERALLDAFLDQHLN